MFLSPARLRAQVGLCLGVDVRRVGNFLKPAEVSFASFAWASLTFTSLLLT